MAAKKMKILDRDGVLEAMRFLGWITHDEQGNITDEAFHVSRELAGKVAETVMLSVQIAEAVQKYRGGLQRQPDRE